MESLDSEFARDGRPAVLLINSGSRVGAAVDAQGWTNTPAGARAAAETWLAKMRAEGIADVELLDVDPARQQDNGRWLFEFRHTVTGVVAELETHGIDDLDAYRRQHKFEPRVYWRGSSSSTPELSDFAAPGYVATFRVGGDQDGG